jgi:hypothetical protein
MEMAGRAGMVLLRLSESQSQIFDECPEAAMGFHFAQAGERLCLVLSGRVLMLLNTKDIEGSKLERSNQVADKLWFRPDTRAISEDVESKLLSILDPAPDIVKHLSLSHPLVMGFILNPLGYLPPTPPRPAYIYGHLPFDGITQVNDVFYRCEHWLTSRRVLLATGDVLRGTYGFPESELPFVPTGFAAVGRYALPNLPPACRRYEIRPPSSYKLKCGAAVPLYGQAGGGVEVMFPHDFRNSVAPIPPPTILQPL